MSGQRGRRRSRVALGGHVTGRGGRREPLERGRQPIGTSGETEDGTLAGVLALAAAATLGLRALAGLAPSNWTWGLATFSYVPAPWMAALFVLATAGLTPGLAAAIGRGLLSLGRAWERWPAADVLAALAVAVILFVVRDPLRFVGDHVQRHGLFKVVPDQVQVIMGRSYPLDWLLNYRLPKFLGPWMGGPVQALSAIGALLGGAFAWIACRFARTGGARGAALPTAVLVLLGGGALIHFSGYDKFGPLLLGWAVAGWGALRLARGQGGLAWLAAGSAIGMLAHRSGFLMVPSAAWALAIAYRRGAPSARRAILAAAVAILGLAAVLAPRTWQLGSQFDLTVHLPGGAVAESRLAAGAPRALIEASDALNAMMFVAPSALLGLAAALWLALGRRRRRAAAALEPGAANDPSSPASFSLAGPTLLALGAMLALLVSVRPGAGWARDWDVATPAGVVVSLVAAGLLIRAWRTGERAPGAAAVFTLALASTLALWGLHAAPSLGMRRIEAVLEASPRLSPATRAQWYDFLGVRAYNGRRPREAIAYFRRSIAEAPNPRLFTQLGLAFLSGGERDSARATFRHAVALDPNTLDSWMELARMALAEGDTAGAVQCLDSVLARKPDPGIRAAREQLLDSMRGRLVEHTRQHRRHPAGG
jgi:tetratricopeptide (TPR) repeat protein